MTYFCFSAALEYITHYYTMRSVYYTSTGLSGPQRTGLSGPLSKAKSPIMLWDVIRKPQNRYRSEAPMRVKPKIRVSQNSSAYLTSFHFQNSASLTIGLIDRHLKTYSEQLAFAFSWDICILPCQKTKKKLSSN